ncbi:MULTISPECIES: ThuA domain-containing protein [Haloferax]|uniref:Trehalose utilisation n=1 Tax=Haloferax massiliensis TaxID=1476858 RepID=A0A0D6JUV3_9EURY|nr:MULTISPECIES: ThuA domain-containing protein [Haloferax]MDS0243246.1 ThuA domain-containing protein [Haloferax sp. S2CR25]MDS0446367.1 ThuA domain-containing protein [Haloferax sp. S2CR25-2]CQR52461.1 Trehalose utilisation [Haloferax massiliensis]
MVSVTVWNEYVQERTDEEVAAVYPDGIHAVLAEALESRGHDVRVATFDEPDHGLTDAVLDDTDALVWWGHKAHQAVEDAVVERVCEHVYDGMGFVPLHSAHFSKAFKRLMGTPCSLRYRESGERERVWVVDPGHPIADGLDESFVVPETEMYGEPFAVPEPDRLVFASWFEGGEVFRSGCCYRRGSGRIFYFRPGHETYPVYEVPVVREVLDNAVRWAAAGVDEAVPTVNRAVDPVE